MTLNWTKRIPLTETGVRTIKAVAGVYRLIHHDSGAGKYYVHYVGQAENLNERLSQHLDGSETNNCCQRYLDRYKCYFRAAAVPRQADRDGAEVALYEHFSEPSCVERIPDVKPLDINFE